jgi:hypothetical protein
MLLRYFLIRLLSYFIEYFNKIKYNFIDNKKNNIFVNFGIVGIIRMLYFIVLIHVRSN